MGAEHDLTSLNALLADDGPLALAGYLFTGGTLAVVVVSLA